MLRVTGPLAWANQLGPTGLQSPMCQTERGSIKRWDKVPVRRASPCFRQFRSLLSKLCALFLSPSLTLRVLVWPHFLLSPGACVLKGAL